MDGGSGGGGDGGNGGGNGGSGGGLDFPPLLLLDSRHEILLLLLPPLIELCLGLFTCFSHRRLEQFFLFVEAAAPPQLALLFILAAGLPWARVPWAPRARVQTWLGRPHSSLIYGFVVVRFCKPNNVAHIEHHSASVHHSNWVRSTICTK